MLDREDFLRYNRQISLQEVGVLGQELLKKAKVLVIGAGGLGCSVIPYLAAAGVGTIGVVDFDAIEKSNLNRQLVFSDLDVGQNKATCLVSKLTNHFSKTTFKAYPIRFSKDIIVEEFSDYSIVVDACDDIETCYAIDDFCALFKKPLVYGAIQKFEGQIGVFNYNNSKKYSDLFPAHSKDLSLLSCDMNGVIGVIPGIVGLFQANEVIKVILEMDVNFLLVNRILVYNFLDHTQRIINY